MYHHKLYSEFMSVIQGEVFVRSAFYKIFIHAKNIRDLISKFEPNQQDRISNDHNNVIGNSNQNHISWWASDLLCFSLGHHPDTDWEIKYASYSRILLNFS